MPQVRYPKRIFLDDFLDDFTKFGGWTPQCIHMASQKLQPAVVPGRGHIPGGRWDPILDPAVIGKDAPILDAVRRQLARVRQARVTVVTAELKALVMEAANGIIRRFAKGDMPLAQFALAPLPTTPQWIEFEPPYLGDETFQIKALWFDTARHCYGNAVTREMEMREINWPVPDDTVVMSLLESTWEMKSMHLYSDGSHAILQGGACANTGCAIARTTREGFGYAVHSRFDMERAVSGSNVCRCHVDAWCWSVILYCLFAYLRMEQAQGPEAIETVSYRVETPHMKRRASGRDETLEAVEAWNQARPASYRVVHVVKPKTRITRLARSGGTIEVETVPANGTGSRAGDDRYEPVEHMLEPHLRLLVAAPGSRWLKTQIVPVTPKNPRRYWRRKDSAGTVRILAEP